MNKDDPIVVTGAGGFIGGHLVADLLRRGHRVRAVDIKPPGDWHQLFPEADNRQRDLTEKAACYEVAGGAVYRKPLEMDR